MSFMILPPEIRVKIYKVLLFPHPKPGARAFAPSLCSYNTIAKLHPSILRVNKLIYKEAHPILYSTNTLVLDLRPDFFGNVQAINATQWSSNTREQRLILRKGGIYRQGLELVRQIQIKVDEEALWSEPFRMNRFTLGEATTPPFSPAARILTSLLTCLSEGSDAEEVETEEKKTLKLQLKIQQSEHGSHVLKTFLRGQHDEFRSEMMRILRMAREVQLRRNVEVELELKHRGEIKATIDFLKLGLDQDQAWR